MFISRVAPFFVHDTDAAAAAAWIGGGRKTPKCALLQLPLIFCNSCQWFFFHRQCVTCYVCWTLATAATDFFSAANASRAVCAEQPPAIIQRQLLQPAVWYVALRRLAINDSLLSLMDFDELSSKKCWWTTIFVRSGALCINPWWCTPIEELIEKVY